MASSGYHESLWRARPPGRTPTDFRRRRSFLLDGVAPGERVLDLGCGEGFFSVELARAGARPVAVDVAWEPLVRAQRRLPGLEVHRLREGEPWPLRDASFDAVWAGEVIEHVADTAGWLSEVRRVLCPGGCLLLTTPDQGWLKLLALALAPAARRAHFDPRSDHLRFYCAATLRTLLTDFGFQAPRVRGVGGVPGARRLLLAQARRTRY